MIRLISYLLQYRISEMVSLVQNSKKPPLRCSEPLSGKTAVITGATSGIGRETALLFASKGASLICVNRNAQKSLLLEEEITKKYKTQISTILCDFASLDDVKKAAVDLIEKKAYIDYLILNAGVYYEKKEYSKDNIEMVFQVNHLSPFLLTHLLMETLMNQKKGKIMYVNSEGHRFALAGVHLKDLDWKKHRYSGLKSYGAAKTAQLLSVVKFAELLKDSGVAVNAMHPGNVKTNIGNNNSAAYRAWKEKHVLKTALEPAVSAEALYYLCASPAMEGVSGKFFNLTTEEKPAVHARDVRAVEPVWQKSLELCGLS